MPSQLTGENLWVLPYRHSVLHFYENLDDGAAVVGWNVLSLKEFIDKLSEAYFPGHRKIKPAERFGLVHKILLDSDFLDEYKNLKYKTGIAEALVELFVVLDEAAIFSESDISEISHLSDERTRKALQLYAVFRHILTRRGLLTQGDVYYVLAEKIGSNGNAEFFRNKKEIVFHNFAEFTLPQREFIKVLSNRFQVTISFPHPRSFYPESWCEIIDNLAGAFDQKLENSASKESHWLTEALSGNPELSRAALAFDTDKIPEFGLFQIPDPRREVELAARMCKILCEEQNISPDEIFVICPNPERYSHILAAAFDELALPYSFSINTEAQSNPVKILHKIIAVHKADWRRKEFFELLEHPILRIGFEDIELEQLRLKCIRWGVHDKKGFIESQRPELLKMRKIIEELDFLLESYDASGIPNILTRLADAIGLEQFISNDTESNRKVRDVWNELETRAEELSRGYGTNMEMPTILLLSSLLHIFRQSDEKRESIDIGIRLLKTEECRDIRAKFAFFIGFSANNFPAKHRRNSILIQEYSDFVPFVSDRKAVGNFSLLSGLLSAKSFFLTYPHEDGDREVGCGQSIDEIFRFCYDDKKQGASNGAKILKLFESYALSPFDIIVRGAMRSSTESTTPQHLPEFGSNVIKKISPSRLETYADCHYAFLLECLMGELEPEEDFLHGETLSPMILGNAIHKTLEQFYRQRYERVLGEIPISLTYKNSGDAAKILAEKAKSILSEFESIAQRIKIDEDSLEKDSKELSQLLANHINTDNWIKEEIPYSEADILEFADGFRNIEFARKILESEIELTDKFNGGKIPFAFELKLETPLKIDETEAILIGRLDRLDLLPDGSFVIIDYKSGTAPGMPQTLKEKDNKLMLTQELQLQIYALMLFEMGLDVSCLIYFSRIRDWLGPIVLSADSFDRDEFREKIGEMLYHISIGDFDATGTKNKSCGNCSYSSVCEFAK